MHPLRPPWRWGHPTTEEGPPTEKVHPLIMCIRLRTPGMILNTANNSSGHQATVDNRPKRAPLSDMSLMISYIALDII